MNPRITRKYNTQPFTLTGLPSLFAYKFGMIFPPSNNDHKETNNTKKNTMTKEVCSNIGLWLLFTLLLSNYVVDLEASHHVYNRLTQSSNIKSPSVNQPYRTGFHFQPPKNWMNGMFNTTTLISASLSYCFYFSNLLFLLYGSCLDKLDWSLAMSRS